MTWDDNLSSTLTCAGSDVLFWKSVLTSKRHYLLIVDTIMSIGNKLGIDISAIDDLSETQMNNMIRKAWEDSKVTQKESVQVRAKWLESVTRHKAANDEDGDKVKELNLIIQKLHDKQMHRKLSAITK